MVGQVQRELEGLRRGGRNGEFTDAAAEPSRIFVDDRHIASRDAELWQAAEATAAERGEAISDVLRRALQEYIAQSSVTPEPPQE